MSVLVGRDHIGVLFMLEGGSQFSQRFLDLPTGDDASRRAKEVVRAKMIRKKLNALLLAADGVDHPITRTSGDTMIASHFGVHM